MGRAARMTAAAALMLAIACLPVVLDQCAASCDAHQTAVAPPCHHSPSTGTHLSHAPAGCNHDHASAGAVQGASVVPQRTPDLTAVLPSPHLPAVARLSRVLSTHAPPGSPGPSQAGSLPLRI